MGTLTKFCLWFLKWRGVAIPAKEEVERRQWLSTFGYRARGRFEFAFRPNLINVDSIAVIRGIILDVMSRFPWRGECDPQNQVLGDGIVVKRGQERGPEAIRVGKFSSTHDLCFFYLKLYDDLPWSKLKAYEKFLETLCQELSQDPRVKDLAINVGMEWSFENRGHFPVR